MITIATIIKNSYIYINAESPIKTYIIYYIIYLTAVKTG